MAPAGTPVVFVHGLWLHADSWGPWVERFRQEGYEPTAPGWPGDADTIEETRQHPERVADNGIQDVVEHYAGIIGKLDAKPIAHRPFVRWPHRPAAARGGCGRGRCGDRCGADQGCRLPAALGAAGRLRCVAEPRQQEGRRLVDPPAVPLRLRQCPLRAGVGRALRPLDGPFPRANVVRGASANLSRHSPAKVNTENATRGPLLLTAGGKDHTVPPAITRSTLKQYRKSPAVTDYKEFHDRGHSLALDSRWPEVADTVLSWLKRHSL